MQIPRAPHSSFRRAAAWGREPPLYVCMYVCEFVYIRRGEGSRRCMFVCMYVCIYVSLCVYAAWGKGDAAICMYIYIYYIIVYIYMYVCMYVCMYVYAACDREPAVVYECVI
jgi:hypothetical protein